MKINSITPMQYSNKKTVPAMNNIQANPAFKGIVPQPIVNGLSNFYEGVAAKGGFQKFIKWFSNSNKSFTHLMVAESCFLSGFYMINTLRNKKIKKEQKPQMLINDALTLGVSTAGAYLLDGKITNFVSKAAEKYFVNHKDFYSKLGAKIKETASEDLTKKVADAVKETDSAKLKAGIENVAKFAGEQLKGIVGKEGHLKAFQITPDKLSEVQTSIKNAVSNNAGDVQKAAEAVKNATDDVFNSLAARAEANKILPGINKLKTIVIFGIIYRYLGPVVITPIANKISAKFFDKKKEEKKN